MKFLKYFFYAFLPIMLLMMFFSYNNFSFIGAKAGASSTTNTINFYGKDNYLIGSYDVPNGQSINDTKIITGYNQNTLNILDFYNSNSASRGMLAGNAFEDNIYYFNDDKTIFSYNGNAKRYYSDSNLYYDFKVTALNSGDIWLRFGYLLSNFSYPSTLNFDFESYFYCSKRPYLTWFNNMYFTIYEFDNTYSLVNFYNIYNFGSHYAGGEISDTYTFNISNIENFYYNSSNNYYIGFNLNYGFVGNGSNIYVDCYIHDATCSTSTPIYTPLKNIINQDISTAVSNGYIDLQDNYSWSTQSNFNNGFTYDTDIYYDLDLYYVQDNKVFNFANGWQSTLGDLSNLSFFTNTALAEVISDFNTFNTLNFDGDFLHVLKTIGLAIANICNVIISLAQLVVAPLIDMVSIIVLLITKSSFFWTFT